MFFSGCSAPTGASAPRWLSATRDDKSSAGHRVRHSRLVGFGYYSAAEPSRWDRISRLGRSSNTSGSTKRHASAWLPLRVRSQH